MHEMYRRRIIFCMIVDCVLLYLYIFFYTYCQTKQNVFHQYVYGLFLGIFWVMCMDIFCCILVCEKCISASHDLLAVLSIKLMGKKVLEIWTSCHTKLRVVESNSQKTIQMTTIHKNWWYHMTENFKIRTSIVQILTIHTETWPTFTNK